MFYMCFAVIHMPIISLLVSDYNLIKDNTMQVGPEYSLRVFSLAKFIDFTS